MVIPKKISSPERLHRIGVNATTDTMELIAPNGRVAIVPSDGTFGPWPVNAVNASISSWMRWSGLSIGASRNRPR